MHIITKILVVFAAVLAVLLSALTVAFTYNAAMIVQENQRMSQQVASLSADIKARDGAFALARQEWDQERASLVSQKSALEADRTNAKSEAARLLADVKDGQTRSASLRSQIEQMSATQKTLALLIESYRSELTNLRDGQLRNAERETELADRINDLTGQLQVAQDNNRALQEQLAELQTAMSQDGAIAAAPGASPRTTSVLEARVTRVTPDSGSGNTFAEIDAGSNDRIRTGMELNIVRDGRFLAKFVVTRVDLQKAIGRIDTLNRSVKIRSGDTVISALR